MDMKLLADRLDQVFDHIKDINDRQAAGVDNMTQIQDSIDVLSEQNAQKVNVTGIQLEPFHGHSSEDSHSWIRKFQSYADLHNWDNHKKFNALGLLLKETAEVWFNNLPPPIAQNFQAFVQEFRAHFSAQNPRWITENELFSRVQNVHESVESYYSALRKQGSKLAKTDAEILSYFIRGLRPAIKAYVIGQNPLNIDEAYQKAKIGESIAQITPDSSDLSPQIEKMLKIFTEQSNSITTLQNVVEEQARKICNITSARTTNNSKEQKSNNRRESTQYRPPNNMLRTRNNRSRPFCGYCNRTGHTTPSCFRRLAREHEVAQISNQSPFSGAQQVYSPNMYSPNMYHAPAQSQFYAQNQFTAQPPSQPYLPQPMHAATPPAVPLQPPHGSRVSRPTQCYKCRNFGHMARDCPN